MINIDCLWSQVKVDVRERVRFVSRTHRTSRVEKRDGLYNFSILHLEVAGFPI